MWDADSYKGVALTSKGIWGSSLWRWLAINVIIGFVLFSPAISQNVHSQKTSAARSFTVAVIDTGMDVRHSFISDNIWTNPGEVGLDAYGRSKATNGVDDDGNGFVDDVHGWNFIDSNNDIRDFNGHGTHIAGSIKKTIYRENPYAPFKMMALKYFSTSDECDHKKAFIHAIEYAINAGVDIINISGGGNSYDRREFDLLEKARARGILVVAAAGNKKSENAYGEFFPAAYQLSNVISVVATTDSGEMLATSNLNEGRENVYMPGQRIWSTLPENKFGYKTGSSQAAAIYTGHYIARRASTYR